MGHVPGVSARAIMLTALPEGAALRAAAAAGRSGQGLYVDPAECECSCRPVLVEDERFPPAGTVARSRRREPELKRGNDTLMRWLDGETLLEAREVVEALRRRHARPAFR